MDGTMSKAGTSKGSKIPHNSSWRLINSYRYLVRETMLQRAVENAKARKKRQRKNKIANLKRKRIEDNTDTQNTTKTVKKRKLHDNHLDNNLKVESTLNSIDSWTCVAKSGQPPVEGPLTSGPRETNKTSHQISVTKKLVVATLSECWEVDSGFSSEASPTASGRSSPCYSSMYPALVVAMDCEMVGTGPSGRCSELARCSLLDYHGNVLYDKYISPCQPVTDYRTRWSGIQRHHLQNAVPFPEARTEILRLLEGKVVIGHALYNDFQALDSIHPGHMIRDTSYTRLLRQLAGFPTKRCVSLKILSNKLLNRKIQVGRRGHSSVEDALAALDLYKLVEREWELDLQEKMRDRDTDALPDPATSNHYMQDQYWPEELTDDSQ